jgi:hypothetical protein
MIMRDILLNFDFVEFVFFLNERRDTTDVLILIY